MRSILGFAAALLAAVVPLVAAQDMTAALQALPQCAVGCLVDGITHSTCSTNLTAACICTNAPLQQQITLCVSASCTTKEMLVTKNVTDTSCGVPVRDRGATYNATSITLIVIACTIVLIRLCFKVFVIRSLSPDDYVVFALLVITIPSVIITSIGTTPNGVGRDIWALTPKQITDFLFYFYLMAMLYFVQVALVKIAMLLFYLRIFPAQNVRRLLWGTVIFSVLFGIFFFFLAIFQCQPISFFWTHWDGEHEGKCLNSNAIAWANAGISIALDVWMLVIPLAELKSLNLHWKKKIGVGFMFLVGTFVTIVSIIRLQALVTFGTSANATWDNFPVSLWSTVEIAVGIMCTCMPTLRLLLVRLFPALGGGSSAYGRGAYYGKSGGAAGRSGGGGRPGGSSNRMGNSKSRRTLGNLTSTSRSHNDDNMPPSTSISLDTVSAKQMGIVRQQTFAVQYDDDEASLVHMKGMDRGGRKDQDTESL